MSRASITSIISNDFIRSISILATGTALAQLIPILIQPILRRHYPEDVFGTYAVYLSLVGILYVVTSLRFEQAIVLPQKDKESMHLMYISQLFNVLFSVFFFLVVILFHNRLLTFLNIPIDYSIFLYLVPLGTLLFNLGQCIQLWIIRQKNFRKVSALKLYRRGAEGGFQIGFTYIAGTFGLLWGDILGQLINVGVGFRLIFQTGYRFSIPSAAVLIALLKKYSEYPKFNTATTFLHACALFMPVLIVNRYYGTVNAAYFDLSRMVLLLPIALIGSSVSNVMLQRVAEHRREKRFFKTELLIIGCLGITLAAIEMLVIYPWGETLFSLFFGDRWATSGLISRIMLWPYLLYFFTFSFTSIFLALQKIKLLSLYQIINALAVGSLFLFTALEFYHFLKVFALIAVFSTSIFMFLLAQIVWQYKKQLKSE